MNGEQSDLNRGLYRIIYDSVVLLPFGETGARELNHLVASAQAHNARNGVTGVLRYDGAYFLQVLEGPRSAVQETMARILRDPRHGDVRITAQGPVTRRDFADWSMVLVTDQDVACARLRDPNLLEVQPFRAAEVVVSFRAMLGAGED